MHTTTVYVTAAPMPTLAHNTTAIYVVPSPVPESSSSTPCTSSTAVPEKPTTSAYVPEKPTTSAYVPEKPTTSAYVPEKPTTSAYVPPPPAPTTYKPAPSPSKPASQPQPSKPAHGGYGAGHITPNGQKWALTYTPYADNGDCRSADVIKSDIAKIAKWGYTTIRVYSVDCGVFETVVPAAEECGLKVIYGIFLDATNGPDSPAANEQLDAIIKGAGKASTAMLIVGNEYVFNGGSLPALVAYVKKCREAFYAAGFSTDIPVTTTETVGVMETPGNEAICEALAVLTVQIHPFFDYNTEASQAGDFALSQLEMAAKVCPEAAKKGKYITEIGWPHKGSPNGKAIASKDAQYAAIKSIVEKVGDVSCLLSYADDG